MTVDAGIIYCATCRVNGKRYVGYTRRGLDKRKRVHVSAALRSEHGCTIFNRAIRKHGPDAFVWTVLERGVPEEVCKRETYWIEVLRSLAPNGYNLTTACVEGGGCVSDATKAKISAGNKGRPAWNKGKPCSAETKAKIGAANKGRPSPNKGKPAWNKGKKATPEARANMSKAQKGKKGQVPWNKGKPCSDATKAKMSASRKGKPAWNKGKPCSDATKAKLSASNTGKKHTAEHNAKISAGLSAYHASRRARQYGALFDHG